MIPIFEQGSGKGIGHNVDSFIDRFDEILAQHIAEGRARAFAFILYDFTDHSIGKILRDQGGFARLDRLSGKNIGIFYLHNGTRRTIERFNTQFLTALDLKEEAKRPCVVFFKFEDQRIIDISVAQLESSDLIHGFEELYRVVDTYISDSKTAPDSPQAMKWAKSGATFVGIEMFRAALRRAFDYF
jgi:hypothetical protein